jgi:hypothetical protein
MELGDLFFSLAVAQPLLSMPTFLPFGMGMFALSQHVLEKCNLLFKLIKYSQQEFVLSNKKL